MKKFLLILTAIFISFSAISYAQDDSEDFLQDSEFTEESNGELSEYIFEAERDNIIENLYGSDESSSFNNRDDYDHGGDAFDSYGY